ncbi:hypothetical protein ATE84_5214 [Aquimarina sp. MAR_2010_214]|nr:hypothetical protein ATE84_5214 [Aquimarina sp. MAR_2010_214]
MLHPTAKGIFDGRIKGLNNSVHITMYVDNGIKGLKIPDYYTSPGIEYYIGFGTGYEQGQKLRVLLEKDSSSQMSLDEKTECLSFLLIKQETCRLILSTESFLDNIKCWEEFNIPKTTIDEIQNLLKENKTQRAVDKILIYLKEKFYLKSLMEFYTIYDELKRIRQKKKKNKEYIIIEELEKIKIEIQNWISLK